MGFSDPWFEKRKFPVGKNAIFTWNSLRAEIAQNIKMQEVHQARAIEDTFFVNLCETPYLILPNVLQPMPSFHLLIRYGRVCLFCRPVGKSRWQRLDAVLGGTRRGRVYQVTGSRISRPWTQVWKQIQFCVCFFLGKKYHSIFSCTSIDPLAASHSVTFPLFSEAEWTLNLPPL